MTIQESLKKGAYILKENNIESSNLKSRILLAHLLQKPKEYLLIHLTDSIDEKTQKEYEKQLEKLTQNIPLQYITNTQEFMGLSFYVNENVLIPRADTEVLVEEVLKNCKNRNSVKILDMCTGSGAIAISLAKYIKNADITAVDISKKALDVAKINAINNQVKIDFIESNLFENVKKTFDIIVSNPPYIETKIIKTLDKQVQKEPLLALDGGEDGLEFYKLISKNAKQYLNNDGVLAVEIGYNQKNKVIELFNADGYKNCTCIKDLNKNDRVVICNK